MSSETSPMLSSSPRTDPHPITVYDAQLAHPERSNTGPPYFRDSPMRLILYDLGVVLRHAGQIPNLFLPLSIMSDIGPLGLVLQIVFVLVSLALTGVGLLSFSTGFPAPFLTAGAIGVALVIMSRVQGNVKMKHECEDKFEDEAWLYVNGIATSASGLRLVLAHLHEVFGRRVTGIHNKTFGIWWDLVEALLQRDFLWGTADVRVGYEDQLLSDFPADALRKVEIYTFAAAANHFSVPSSPVYPDTNAAASDSEGSVTAHIEAKGTGSRQVGRRFVFGIVEHFVNTRDYVPLIGLLEFAPCPPKDSVPGVLPSMAAEGRFAGRIFKREGHTGHLLISHYLLPGDSILDHPTVERYSQLVKYKNGQRAEVEDRYWKPTIVTESPVVAVSAST